MKKILFIGTGGTIASELSGGSLSPTIGAEQLIRLVPGLGDMCEIEARQPFTLDSTDITTWHWLMIAREIEDSYNDFDGFVVAHGTDTLAYTAAALSYLIQDSEKPIIITGAQKPIGFDSTDSKQNLRDSFICACSGLLHGVLVVFGGEVLLGTRVRKTRSKSFSAFESPNYPAIGTVKNGRLTVFFCPVTDGHRFYSLLESSVGLLKLTPATDLELLSFMLSRYSALVIEAFGVGGLPHRNGTFKKEVQRAIEAGKTVVLTTQVESEGTDMSVYNVGSGLSDIGVIEAFDMTPEACIVKLMWLLPRAWDNDSRREMFYRPVACDIFPPERSEK